MRMHITLTRARLRTALVAMSSPLHSEWREVGVRLESPRRNSVDAEYFRLTYDFSCWARDRLLVAATKLSDDEWRRDNGFTYKSIGGILLHAMQAERLNAMRMMGTISGPAPAQSTEVLAAADLLAEWQEAEATLRP